jgi:DNA-binding HxlR family transcriptional regulator
MPANGSRQNGRKPHSFTANDRARFEFIAVELSSPARVVILLVLVDGPLQLDEIMVACDDFSQSGMSTRLRSLRQANLVEIVKEGHDIRRSWYGLTPRGRAVVEAVVGLVERNPR